MKTFIVKWNNISAACNNKASVLTCIMFTGTTEEDLHKQFEEGAAKRVKTNLVLEAIVAAEGVTATEEEIDKEIKELAAQYGMDEKAVRSALSDDMLNHDISIRKVVDEITDSAKQVEKD